ncbi:Cell cycle control protein 50A [Heterocephalus glaber]|uniref:Cell cycle control protein 50A n=1 Tax=Heterocephalus glaber TaxID=10181 RepID=G5AQ13_HETGA|nr:Cell cycle control protein 50A [Heterocephalus glaber]
MAMNCNAKDEVDGGPQCALGGAAKTRRPDNTAFKQQRLPAWLGFIFIPIGIGIFVTSNNIREIKIDYTGTEPSSPCNKCLSRDVTLCICTINFTLEKAFEGNVFMYYSLSNFYQNHGRYVKSRDDRAIANSMFNDTLELYLVANESDPTPSPIHLKRKGIAWWTDKHVKFRNPPGEGALEERFKGTTKPVNWLKPVYMVDSEEDNNGFINEDCIV